MFKRFVTPAMLFVSGFALCAVIWGGNLASLAKGTLSNQAAPATSAQATPTSPTGQQWEYRVVTGHSLTSISERDVNAKLSNLTEQGFDIYWLDQTSSAGEFHLTIALRRPRR